MWMRHWDPKILPSEGNEQKPDYLKSLLIVISFNLLQQGNIFKTEQASVFSEPWECFGGGCQTYLIVGRAGASDTALCVLFTKYFTKIGTQRHLGSPDRDLQCVKKKKKNKVFEVDYIYIFFFSEILGKFSNLLLTTS